MPRVRVAHLLVDLGYGGAQRLVQWAVPRLDRARFEPAVFVLTGDAPLGPALEAAGVPVHRLRMAGKGDARILWRLPRALRDFGAEILHTHLAPANALGRVGGRLAGVKHVRSTIHTLEGAWWHRALERATKGLAHSVEFVSEAVARHAREELGLEGEVVRPGVPAPATRPSPARRPHFVAAAARLVPGKGIDDLIDAIARLEPPRARLLVLGDGPERRRLERRAAKAGVDAEFAGWVEDVPAALAGAAVAAFPSRLGEGSPLGPVEAMLAGVPVVAADAGGAREVVGPAGLVPPGDVAALAAKLGALLADPVAARRAAEPERERALREFGIDRLVARWEAAYSSSV